MSGIKKINSTSPGVLRPVQVSDLQDLWDFFIESLALGGVNDTYPRIVSGFDVNVDNTITSGVMSYRGQLYFYDDSDPSGKLSIGSTMYAGTVEDSERTIANGAVINFYTKYKIQPVRDGLSNVIALPFSITLDILNSWKVSFIPSGSIISRMIADGAITQEKIAVDSVSGAVVMDNSIPMGKLQGGSFVNPTTVNESRALGPAREYVANRDTIYQVTVPSSSSTLGISFELPTPGVYVFYVTNSKSTSVAVNLKFAEVMSATLGNAPASETSKFTVYYCNDGSLIADQVTVKYSYKH